MPDIPKGATVPQDHKSPAQIEAEGVETVTVESQGFEFTFPADPQDWKAGAIREFEKGHQFEGCFALVGKALWDRRKMDEWTGRQVGELFNLFAETAGLSDSGN